MKGLVVLSPHRDDSVFSLALALTRWAGRGVPITVLNIFTVSGYAPFLPDKPINAISESREREDLRALRTLHPAISVVSLGFLDAPIRLSIDLPAVSAPTTRVTLPASEIDRIWEVIQPYLLRHLVLAPLALGDHIDHWIVHCAAVRGTGSRRVGFYEDLPYASWTADAQISERIVSTEKAQQISLRPAVISNKAALAQKRRAVACYPSQINREMARTITRYSAHHRTGERIWIPTRASVWRPLLSPT